MAYYSWDAILSHVARRIGEESGSRVEPSELIPPPKPDLGDIAFGCFRIAKAQGKGPAEIAELLAEKLSQADHTIESASAAGPYVNVVLKSGDLINRIVQDVEHAGEEYGATDDGKGKQVMLEYAQPNTHKEVHVGHLRNLVLGASIAKLLKRNGWKVVTASYHGDVGAHVSKCLWFLVRHTATFVQQPKPKKVKKGEKPPEPLSADTWTEHVLHNLDEAMANEILSVIPRDNRTGNWLGKLYAEASKLLKENPDWKTEVSLVQQALESHAKGWEVLWHETRRWSLLEMAEIFQDLGVAIDRQYFESEVVEEGQRIVDNLLKKKIARMSEGAVIIDLQEEKLGVFLVRKSDGTSLYATKDIPLAFLKLKEYPSLQRALILVDNRQSLYFKQLFETLKQMGMKTPMEFIGYEFVTLKSGAMSSREGNVVTWQSLRDEIVGYAKRETLKRHAEWSEGQLQHTSWALAMGGVKYGMLKQDSDKIYMFELERALSFDGDTGPYVQYAATRLGAILKKAGWNPDTGIDAGDLNLLMEPMEKRLVLQMAIFPETCRRAAAELRPAIVAHWCSEMAQRMSDFYRDVNVIESDIGMKQARLRLIAATRSVLANGLDLLGIPLPDEM